MREWYGGLHVVLRLKLHMPDLTLSLATNELSHLTEQPTKARKSLQTAEEQEHCLFTRRAPEAHWEGGGSLLSRTSTQGEVSADPPHALAPSRDNSLPSHCRCPRQTSASQPEIIYHTLSTRLLTKPTLVVRHRLCRQREQLSRLQLTLVRRLHRETGREAMRCWGVSAALWCAPSRHRDIPVNGVKKKPLQATHL